MKSKLQQIFIFVFVFESGFCCFSKNKSDYNLEKLTVRTTKTTRTTPRVNATTRTTTLTTTKAIQPTFELLSNRIR